MKIEDYVKDQSELEIYRQKKRELAEMMFRWTQNFILRDEIKKETSPIEDVSETELNR